MTPYRDVLLRSKPKPTTRWRIVTAWFRGTFRKMERRAERLQLLKLNLLPVPATPTIDWDWAERFFTVNCYNKCAQLPPPTDPSPGPKPYHE